MSLLLLGVVRLTAHYEYFGRPSSMTFHFRTNPLSAPSYADCKLVADTYGLWENTGFGLGYALLRHQDSHFTHADCRSLDPRADVSFVDNPFSRPGLLGGPTFAAQPAGLAPVMHWATAERGPKSGRTYALGLTTTLFGGTGDFGSVSDIGRAALTTIFRALTQEMRTNAAFIQCVPHYRYSPGPKTLLGVHTVLDVGCASQAGFQRRRAVRVT